MNIIRDKINKIQNANVQEKYEQNLKQFEDRIKLLGVGSSNLILFLGAGVSRNYGIKMWQELGAELVKKLEEKSLRRFLKSKDLKYKIQIAFTELNKEGRLLNILKKEVLYDKERETIEKKEEKAKEKGSQHIIQSLNNFKDNDNVKYITTNIDRLLEVYLNENSVLFSNSKSGDKIIKLHGCINDIESLVFTPKQYIDMYSTLDKDKIEDIFSKATVLFVGKSLEDEIIQMLFKSKRLNDIYLLKDYKDDRSYEQKLKYDFLYYDDINVKVLPYTDYSQLPNIMNEIYSKVGIYKKVKNISELRIEHFLETSELANSINLLSEELKRGNIHEFKNEYTDILNDIKQNEAEIFQKLWFGSIGKFLELKKVNDGNLEDVWRGI